MQKNKVIIKWIARISGLLVSIFYIVFIIAEGIPDTMERHFNTLYPILTLMGIIILGFLFAWFREKEGGVIMIFGSIILGLYVYYMGIQNNVLYALLITLSFLIPALLFIYYHRLNIK